MSTAPDARPTLRAPARFDSDEPHRMGSESGIYGHERSSPANEDRETYGEWTVTLLDRLDDDSDEAFLLDVTGPGYSDEVIVYVDHHSRRLTVDADADDWEANRAAERFVRARTEVRSRLP